MQHSIDDEQLERYLAGTLPTRSAGKVERALRKSAELRKRLEELRAEAEVLKQVVDSQAIRLVEDEERRVVSEVTQKLRASFKGVK
jgi:anti-sigma factor RsiW